MILGDMKIEWNEMMVENMDRQFQRVKQLISLFSITIVCYFGKANRKGDK